MALRIFLYKFGLRSINIGLLIKQLNTLELFLNIGQTVF